MGFDGCQLEIFIYYVYIFIGNDYAGRTTLLRGPSYGGRVAGVPNLAIDAFPIPTSGRFRYWIASLNRKILRNQSDQNYRKSNLSCKL